MKSNRELNKIATQVIKKLKEHNVHILRYDAYSTNSIYLKFDGGVCNSLRISDHAGKQYLSYMYNIIKGYSGQSTKKDKYTQYFYDETQVDKVIRHILHNRDKKIKKSGLILYQLSVRDSIDSNSGKRGFWSQSVEV